jgi:hypothetical protein
MQWLYLICSRAYTFIKLKRYLVRVEVWQENKALVEHSEVNVFLKMNKKHHLSGIMNYYTQGLHYNPPPTTRVHTHTWDL